MNENTDTNPNPTVTKLSGIKDKIERAIKFLDLCKVPEVAVDTARDLLAEGLEREAWQAARANMGDATVLDLATQISDSLKEVAKRMNEFAPAAKKASDGSAGTGGGGAGTGKPGRSKVASASMDEVRKLLGNTPWDRTERLHDQHFWGRVLGLDGLPSLPSVTAISDLLKAAVVRLFKPGSAVPRLCLIGKKIPAQAVAKALVPVGDMYCAWPNQIAPARASVLICLEGVGSNGLSALDALSDSISDKDVPRWFTPIVTAEKQTAEVQQCNRIPVGAEPKTAELHAIAAQLWAEAYYAIGVSGSGGKTGDGSGSSSDDEDLDLADDEAEENSAAS